MGHRITHGVFQPALKRMQPEAVLRVDGLGEDQKWVALTIDDSPSAKTGAILDMLRDRNAVATFFVHGGNIRTKADERLIRRMLDEGHEVANHMPESVPSVSLTPERFAMEFERNHRILESHGAKASRFRSSHGVHNRQMAEFMKTRGAEMGYMPVFYLGLIFPWDVYFPVSTLYARHNACSPRAGRIVVYHDNQDRTDLRGRTINQSQRTLTSLPLFFDSLEKQGFRTGSLASLEALAEKGRTPSGTK